MKRLFITITCVLLVAATFAQNPKPASAYTPKQFPKGSWYFIGNYDAGCSCYTDTLGVYLGDSATFWTNDGRIRIFDTLLFRDGSKIWQGAGVIDAATLQGLDTAGVYIGAAGQNGGCIVAKRDTVTGCATDWVRIEDSLSAKVVDNDSAYRIDNVRALYQNKSYSVFIGKNAGLNTAANIGYNVAIGEDALKLNTTGGTNIAIGANTMDKTTTGTTSSVAIGDKALRYSDDADDNVGIGTSALTALKKGVFNVAIGSGAHPQSDTNNWNTVIGGAAGSIIEGNRNILLGYTSGSYLTRYSDRLVISSMNMYGGSLKQDTTRSIIYGKQDADSSKQHLWLNANVHAQTNLVVGTGGADSVLLNTTHGIKLIGDATVWDDFTVGATQTRVNPSTSLPAFSADSVALQFVHDADSNEIAYFSVQLPHSYKPGSTIEPHIHWIQHAVGDTTWNMRLAYRIHPIAGTSGAWIYTKNTSRAALPFGTKPFHQICEFPAISTAGCKESTVIDFKLYRYDAVGLATVWFKQFDVHVEKNKMGSKNEFPD